MLLLFATDFYYTDNHFLDTMREFVGISTRSHNWNLYFSGKREVNVT